MYGYVCILSSCSDNSSICYCIIVFFLCEKYYWKLLLQLKVLCTNTGTNAEIEIVCLLFFNSKFHISYKVRDRARPLLVHPFWHSKALPVKLPTDPHLCECYDKCTEGECENSFAWVCVCRKCIRTHVYLYTHTHNMSMQIEEVLIQVLTKQFLLFARIHSSFEQ